MKSNIKTLVLALAGLSSFAVAGSAFAACDNTSLAAWTATSVGGGDLSVVPGGYDGSACKLQIDLQDNGTGHGQVRDDSPNAETRYRAQFIFDPVNLNGANGNNQAVIFLANATGVFKNRLALVKLVYGGNGDGTKRLFIIGACDNTPSQNQCQVPVSLPNQTGPNRIEIDLTVGGPGVGALRYWVNDAAATGLTDGAGISIPITGGNAGWTGVDRIFLGMTSPTLTFRSAVAGNGNNVGKLVFFDQFDSRRQTFIGHN